MGHNPTREQVRLRMEKMRADDAKHKVKLSRDEMERRAKRYVAVRKSRMPEMIEAARRKLAGLETEARRYGMDELFREDVA